MKKFEYKAKNRQGRPYSGLVEAREEKLAAKILVERGLIITSLKPKGENIFTPISSRFTGRISAAEKVNFTRQLATMVNSGLALTDALRLLEEQSGPAMGRVVAEVINGVESGLSLSKALSAHEKVFNQVYVALVRAGEEAGVLDKVLNRLAENMEKQKEFTAKVKGALIYPAVVVAGMLMVAVVMMVLVIPKMMTMYEEFSAELPLPTKILMAMSGFMVNFWPVGVVLAAAGVLGWPKLMKQRSVRIKFDRFVFGLPVIGKLRLKAMMTDFARTLGLLVGSGVLVIDALQIVRDSIGSPVFEEAVDKASQSVQRGYPLAAALAETGAFPTILPQMISVGEETGKTDEILDKVANYFGQEAEQAVKNLTTSLEPLIMIVLGVGVGFLVVAIIMPIYNLTSQF